MKQRPQSAGVLGRRKRGKKKVLGHEKLQKSAALRDRRSVAYYDAWKTKKEQDAFKPLNVRVSAIVRTAPTFAKTVRSLHGAQRRVQRASSRALVRSSTGPIANYVREGDSAKIVPDYDADAATQLLSDTARTQLSRFFAFEKSHVFWSARHEDAYERFVRTHKAKIKRTGALGPHLRLASFLLSQTFMDLHQAVLGGKYKPRPRQPPAPELSAATPRTSASSAASLRSEVASVAGSSPQGAEVGRSASRPSVVGSPTTRTNGIADVDGDVVPTVRGSVVIGKIEVFVPKGEQPNRLAIEASSTVKGRSTKRRDSYSAVTPDLSSALARDAKRKSRDLSVVFSNEEKDLAHRAIATEIVEYRDALIESFQRARHAYLKTHLRHRKKKVREHDEAFHQELEIAWRRVAFKREHMLVKYRLRELFGSADLAQPAPETASPTKSSKKVAKSKRRIFAPPDLVRDFRPAQMAARQPLSRLGKQTRGDSTQFHTLTDYQKIKSGQNLSRMFQLASSYASVVSTEGGGDVRSALALRRRAREKAAAKEKAGQVLERAFRGFVARRYVWALRYVAAPETVTAAFSRADSDGDQAASPDKLRGLIVALGGQHCLGGTAGSHASMNSKQVQKVFEDIGIREDGMVHLQDFQNWWQRHLPICSEIMDQLAVIQSAKRLRALDDSASKTREFEEQERKRRDLAVKTIIEHAVREGATRSRIAGSVRR